MTVSYKDDDVTNIDHQPRPERSPRSRSLRGRLQQVQARRGTRTAAQRARWRTAGRDRGAYCRAVRVQSVRQRGSSFQLHVPEGVQGAEADLSAD